MNDETKIPLSDFKGYEELSVSDSILKGASDIKEVNEAIDKAKKVIYDLNERKRTIAKELCLRITDHNLVGKKVKVSFSRWSWYSSKPEKIELSGFYQGFRHQNTISDTICIYLAMNKIKKDGTESVKGISIYDSGIYLDISNKNFSKELSKMLDNLKIEEIE